MTSNPHQQARQLIASGARDLANAQQTWLRNHLDECASCRDYAQAAEQFIGSLRSVPVAASLTLVRTTQARVRLHARQLQNKQERQWLVWMSCVLVCFSAAITTPFSWQACKWIGEWARVSAPVWQVGFIGFWFAPALAAGVLFLARGIYLGDTDGTSRG